MVLPQHPDTLPGFRKERIRSIYLTPDRILLLSDPETLIEAVYSPDERIRLTAREFLGWQVPRLPALPHGEVSFCTHCRQWKNVREFSPDSRKRNGLQSHCKNCRSRANKWKRLSA